DDRRPFVKYWMHNGFVRMQDEKMSKSTGNFATVRELLERYDPEVVRFFVLRAHYRSPLNYSDEHMEEARQALARLYTSLKGAPPGPETPDWEGVHGRRFAEAMDADFNTSAAVAVLFDLAGELNRAQSGASARQLRAFGQVLGLLGRESEEFLRSGGGGGGISSEQISSFIAERDGARRSRDFKRADEIRDELLRHGIALEDGGPRGTTWRRT
ncbi:MAG: DALR domain-containing protein, partial [Burkholderiales bacterium]